MHDRLETKVILPVVSHCICFSYEAFSIWKCFAVVIKGLRLGNVVVIDLISKGLETLLRLFKILLSTDMKCQITCYSRA